MANTPAKKKPTQWLVTTPSADYSGKAVGVRFNNGRAVVSQHTIDPYLKLTVDEVLTKMRDLGYKVTAITEDEAAEELEEV